MRLHDDLDACHTFLLCISHRDRARLNNRIEQVRGPCVASRLDGRILASVLVQLQLTDGLRLRKLISLGGPMYRMSCR